MKKIKYEFININYILTLSLIFIAFGFIIGYSFSRITREVQEYKSRNNP